MFWNTLGTCFFSIIITIVISAIVADCAIASDFCGITGDGSDQGHHRNQSKMHKKVLHDICTSFSAVNDPLIVLDVLKRFLDNVIVFSMFCHAT